MVRQKIPTSFIYVFIVEGLYDFNRSACFSDGSICSFKIDTGRIGIIPQQHFHCGTAAKIFSCICTVKRKNVSMAG
jgi:hypothetical protein